MGFVDDIKRRLTAPGGEAFSQERLQSSQPEYLERPAAGDQVSDQAPPSLYDAAAAARRRRRRVFMTGGLLLGLLVLGGAAYGGVRWYRELRTVQKHHVDFAVAGPERVSSGDEMTLRMRVENKSRVSWENVVVELRLPGGFTLKAASPAPLRRASVADAGAEKERAPATWDLGTLPPRASQEIVFTGRVLGEEGSTALFTAQVALIPANRPETRVAKDAFASVSLASIPVDLSIDVPRAAASGTPITVHVIYQNRTGKDLTGALLQLETPPGFSIRSTTPAVRGQELQWELPVVPPQGQGEVSVAGLIEGESESAKPFRASVGFLAPEGTFAAQRSVQRSLTIERTALSLEQILSGQRDILKVGPGAEIEGVVHYKNTGTGGLREVIVRLSFDGTGLDETSLKVEGGFYDGRKKEITWSAASSPQLNALRPSEAGELKFKFRLLPLSALPLIGPAQNISLRTRAIGDSPDLPTPPGAPKQVASDQFEILLNTLPVLVLDAFFDDGRAGLPLSSGPLPPQVGQETTYTVRVRVTNTSNEVIDGVYRTSLPETVRWAGNEHHTTGDVKFNERTREVTWSIPLLASRAGQALPAPEFAFQVGITPSLNQIGSEVALTLGHVFEGTDAFTTTRVRAEGEAVTTTNADPKRGEVVR